MPLDLEIGNKNNKLLKINDSIDVATNHEISISICSYNVNGLSNKLIYPYFFDFLCKKDVFFCLETHVFQQTKMMQLQKYFPNYKLHWKSAERRSNRGRGIAGLLVGWKLDLVAKYGLQLEITEHENITTLSIKKDLQFIEIIPVYLRNENWRAEFTNLKTYLLNNGARNLAIMGDVNIRIGELQQDIVPYLHNSTKILHPRKSQDKVTNIFGKDFIEMCDDFNLRVLNGAFCNDEEGAFTYSSVLGDSVNDITAVSNSILYKVESFTVDDASWSDHFPITVTIKLTNMNEAKKTKKLLPTLKWMKNKKHQYCSKINQQLSHIHHNQYPTLNEICEIIKTAAPTSNNKIHIRKNPWFDTECERARKESFKMLRIWRKTNQKEEKFVKKFEYIHSNKNYKQLLEFKEKVYWENLKLKLNNVKDSKEWWAISKQYNEKSFTTSSSISATEFITYFKELLGQSTPTPYLFAVPLIQDSILDADITLEEVQLALSKLKDRKAPGEDRIPYEFFKYAPTSMCEAIAQAFTLVYNSETVDEKFKKSVIFPIHKKGNIQDPRNYRGLSFMNCGPKVMMSIMNNRLLKWVQINNILNEYQAGFRPHYSTTDNIYNLSCMAHLKFNERKKLYVFFVDFKAAFDCVPRNALFYKLYNMGVSTKFTRFLERLYESTTSAVWNGEQISDYFETISGVKQGCLISPLLFALFLNDMHDALAGGLWIDNLNIRVLKYADDIALLADEPRELQKMICNLEKYCLDWGLTVNLIKSKIMVLRRGGRLGQNERWKFNNEAVEIVNNYEYLGVTLTPKMSFTEHIKVRTKKAKICVNGIWNKFLSDNDIDIQLKFSIFNSVIRSIQCYSGQIFGYNYEEEINKLQLYFLKYVLRLPDHTPNYAVFLETKQEPTHIYMLKLHMNFIFKTLFVYGNDRLPHLLSLKIIEKGIFWYKEWCDGLEAKTLIRWREVPLNRNRWKMLIQASHENSKTSFHNICLQRKMSSQSRFYKYLDHNVMLSEQRFKLIDITFIAKARCDVLALNGNRFGDVDKRCSLCNMNTIESITHFIGRCPIMGEFRLRAFNRRLLNNQEIIDIFNGINNQWPTLVWFLKSALKYRSELISEFNYE